MKQATDFALVSFDDEQLIWGDKTSQDALSRLHNPGVTKVVVKLGDNTKKRSYSVPPYRLIT
ncbi:hypothetical protein ACWX0P_27490 [Vibrio mediterranei]